MFTFGRPWLWIRTVVIALFAAHLVADACRAEDRAAERARLIKENGGNAASEAAVARGLQWIASQQQADGCWLHGENPSTSNTAMAILPFLGCDITHKSPVGKNLDGHAKCVERGLKYLTSIQNADGTFHKANFQGNCWVIMAITEAHRRSDDDKLKVPTTRAINYLVKQQNKDGGFGADASGTMDTGYALLALEAGQLAGIEVPKQCRERVAKYLDSVGNKEGSAYASAAGQKPSVEATAMALLCREYLGWSDRTPGLNAGARQLAKDTVFKTSDDIQVGFLASQALFNFGGDDWTAWNKKHRDLLIELQHTGENDAIQKGSWASSQAEASQIETTCLAVLTLEVYYFRQPPNRPALDPKK